MGHERNEPHPSAPQPRSVPAASAKSNPLPLKHLAVRYPEKSSKTGSSCERQAKEPPIELATLTEGEDLVADYQSLGLTVGRHPLALLRGRLNQLRVARAVELRNLR